MKIFFSRNNIYKELTKIQALQKTNSDLLNAPTTIVIFQRPIRLHIAQSSEADFNNRLDSVANTVDRSNSRSKDSLPIQTGTNVIVSIPLQETK